MKTCKALFIIIVSLLLLNCTRSVEESEVIGEFDPFLFGVSDSTVTVSQRLLKQALYDLFWERTYIRGKRKMVLPITKSDLIERKIPVEYYKWFKKEIRMTNRNHRKMLRKTDLKFLKDHDFEENFELNRQEYWENRYEQK